MVADSNSNPNIERSLVLLKPETLFRQLTGEIIQRYEKKGLRIVAMKAMQAPRSILEQHYSEHSAKPFFNVSLLLINIIFCLF